MQRQLSLDNLESRELAALATMHRLFPYSCGDGCNPFIKTCKPMYTEGIYDKIPGSPSSISISPTSSCSPSPSPSAASLTSLTHPPSPFSIFPSPSSQRFCSSKIYTSAKAICGRRKTMEDRHSIVRHIVPGTHFIGVFDGHGGASVASGCSQILSDTVRDNLMRGRRTRTNALVDAMVAADTGGLLAIGADVEKSGCTATIALINHSEIIVSYVGDSTAYLLRTGETQENAFQVIALSRNHNPSRPDEKTRIRCAGGTISCTSTDKTERVQGILAVSRAIGDHRLRPFVSGTPEVCIIERNVEDRVMIIATDGLWDVVRPREALMIALSVASRTTKVAAPSAISSVLIQLASDRNSGDNITVTAVLF